MRLELSEDHEALRRELSDYFAGLMTSELKEELRHDFKMEGGGPLWKAAIRKMGADGWIGLGWPEECTPAGGSLEDMEYDGILGSRPIPEILKLLGVGSCSFGGPGGRFGE